MSDNPRNAELGIYGGFSDGTTMDGLDRFEHLQKPDVTPVDDLSRFVLARIVEAELEPRGEIMAAYDQQPAGPMAHRYAKHVRRDMVVFRRILVRYCEVRRRWESADGYIRTGEDPLHGALAEAVRCIAMRWSDHHEFHDEWRLE